jgi:hypothetical protein
VLSGGRHHRVTVADRRHQGVAQSFEQADESGPHERGVFGKHYS